MELIVCVIVMTHKIKDCWNRCINDVLAGSHITEWRLGEKTLRKNLFQTFVIYIISNSVNQWNVLITERKIEQKSSVVIH